MTSPSCCCGQYPVSFFPRLTQMLFVDPIGAQAKKQNGSIKTPYRTIQQAINAIPQAPATNPGQAWAIAVSPGDYDEDLVIDLTGRRIVLTGWGPWGLGKFDAADAGPSTTRNITITVDGPQVNGVRPGFAVGNWLYEGEALTTHQSYLTGARISGGIIVQSTGNFGSVELAVQAETFGAASIDTTGYDNAVQTYIYRSRHRGTVGGQKAGGLGMILQWADRVRFDDPITVLAYSRIQNCRINDDFTTEGADNAGIQPDGFVTSAFTGAHTFDGPPNSLRLDGSSNYWFKTNGWALAGGATKVIQDDLVP